MELKAGLRLRGAADSTEVVVVRAPSGEVDLRCGGHPMIAMGGESNGGSASIDPEFGAGTALGKRYVDDDAGLEVLCTKAGQGSLSLGSKALELKAPKPLPSSD